MINVSVHQRGIVIQNVCAPNKVLQMCEIKTERT